MDFDVIDGELDRARTKRLLGGYVAGALLCGASIALAASVSAAPAEAAIEDDTVEVKLAPSAAPEVKAPEPEPVAPKAPDVEAPRPLGRAQIAAPTAIPTTAPAESEAKPRADGDGTDPYADGKGGVAGGSPNGIPGAAGTATQAVAPPPPAPPSPPPPPPKPAGPIQLPENATPPVAVSNPRPQISNTVLSAAGLDEITVIVKYVVSESGDVSSASIARGNPAVDAQVLAIVRGWKFKPAMFEGRPLSVTRTVKFRFKLKT